MASDLLKIGLTTFVTATAALAIPTTIFLVWLPREFDDLGHEIATLRDDIPDGREIISKIETATSLIQDQGASVDVSLEMVGFLASLMDKDSQVRNTILLSHVSQAKFDEWASTGALEVMKGAVVNGTQFIYIDAYSLNAIPQDDYQALVTASEANGFELKLWDISKFPGSSFELE